MRDQRHWHIVFRTSNCQARWEGLSMLPALVMVVSAITVSVSSLGSASAPVLDVSNESGSELKRGAFFGAKVNSISDEVRERLKLESSSGAMIDFIIPGSTAEGAGFQSGDVLLSLNGAKIEGANELVRSIGQLKANAMVAIVFRRGDAVRTQNITLKGRPLERSDDYEILYGAVSSHGGRLRTIMTRPKGGKKHPAMFLIQGVGTFSVDNPVGALSSYKTLSDDFTRRGFVTLRVDKPGCGDSEGGPTRDVDFDTELDGYRQALKMLKARSDIDPNRVFIFGHSMGGVMAPLLAKEIPVHGMIVYGTIGRTWTEYMLENIRRQMELADADPSAIDRDLKLQASLLNYLYAEKLSPKTIAERYPSLREQLLQTVTDDRYYVDRSLTFFGQLADKNLGAAWETYEGHVLAIWGKGDFVSNEDDHALIARIVNRDHPGHGTFLALDGIDHGFNRAASRRESFERSQRQEPETFNPAILEVCRTWLEKTSAQPASSAKPKA
jgi:dienelactone hydrolase